MYLMYVDESGDPGILPFSPTNHFVLSAITIHETKWKIVLDDLIAFRQLLKVKYGLKLREEIHAAAFISTPKELSRIPKHERLEILRLSLHWLASRPEIMITTVVVNKANKTQSIIEIGWRNLIQRFENGIGSKTFPSSGNADDKALIIPDNTNGTALTSLIREMRRYNPVPNRTDIYGGGYRNLTLGYVIEDPFMKDSATSYFHQMADVVAYFGRQMFQPNTYIKKKYAVDYYKRLSPVLNVKASRSNELGIVLL